MSMDPELPKQLVRKLLNWFGSNARDLPWRRTREPYAIWVSEIMLQQTQVKTVLPYWVRWMQELPDIFSLANAAPERVHKLWEGLGYYSRVRNMQAAAKFVLKEHDGKFPKEFANILNLPGIGRYTAGAICSIAFNKPTPILDGNVSRVLTRIFGIAENPKEKPTHSRLWDLAQSFVNSAAELQIAQKAKGGRRLKKEGSVRYFCSALNQGLMELGALVCTPRNAKCDSCPVNQYCTARREGSVEALPNLGQRPRATNRTFFAFVHERQGRFLVRKRPAGVVNSFLWEFPNMESQKATAQARTVAREVLGILPTSLEPLCTINHTITRYRIKLNVYRAYHHADCSESPGKYLALPELMTLPFSSAHKRILTRISIEQNSIANSKATLAQSVAPLARTKTSPYGG
jgi:A/G-specific adenine glycosylase